MLPRQQFIKEISRELLHSSSFVGRWRRWERGEKFGREESRGVFAAKRNLFCSAMLAFFQTQFGALHLHGILLLPLLLRPL